jgi:hypothetical protein
MYFPKIVPGGQGLFAELKRMASWDFSFPADFAPPRRGNFPVPWTTGEAFLSPISIFSHLPPQRGEGWGGGESKINLCSLSGAGFNKKSAFLIFWLPVSSASSVVKGIFFSQIG